MPVPPCGHCADGDADQTTLHRASSRLTSDELGGVVLAPHRLRDRHGRAHGRTEHQTLEEAVHRVAGVRTPRAAAAVDASARPAARESG